jgi:hypothetical protein
MEEKKIGDINLKSFIDFIANLFFYMVATLLIVAVIMAVSGGHG